MHRSGSFDVRPPRRPVDLPRWSQRDARPHGQQRRRGRGRVDGRRSLMSPVADVAERRPRCTHRADCRRRRRGARGDRPKSHGVPRPTERSGDLQADSAPSAGHQRDRRPSCHVAAQQGVRWSGRRRPECPEREAGPNAISRRLFVPSERLKTHSSASSSLEPPPIRGRALAGPAAARRRGCKFVKVVVRLDHVDQVDKLAKLSPRYSGRTKSRSSADEWYSGN